MSAAHRFGQASAKKLATVTPQLITVTHRALALSPYDFTIVHGWRGEEVQNALYESGASHAPWPESYHNHLTENKRPDSEAIDFGPYVHETIPWKETHIFAVIAGCFFAAAEESGVKIIWGGDWDTDGSTKDQTLMDWGHVELHL